MKFIYRSLLFKFPWNIFRVYVVDSFSNCLNIQLKSFDFK